MDIRKLIDIRFKEDEISFNFPKGFEPAKSVPAGEAGIMCYTCSKWNPDTKLCMGQYYINWNGNGKIPDNNPNEYACVWWVDKRLK
jgi:hypothetical protein